jgi:hypothetical protein
MPATSSLADLTATAFKLDVVGGFPPERGGMALAMLEIIFVFLFVDLFDNVGTLVAVTKKAGLQAARRLDPAAEPHPARRLGRHHGWRRGRHLDRDQLYRERGGGDGRRPHRPDGGGRGPAVPGHPVLRALSSRPSRRPPRRRL